MEMQTNIWGSRYHTKNIVVEGGGDECYIETGRGVIKTRILIFGNCLKEMQI